MCIVNLFEIRFPLTECIWLSWFRAVFASPIFRFLLAVVCFPLSVVHVCGSLLLYFVCVCVFKPFFCAGHCPNRPATHNHTQSVGHMILYTSNDHFEWFVRVRRRCVCAGHRWPSMDLLLCIAPSARLYDINVQFLFLVKQLLDFRALEHQSRLYIAHCIHAYSSIFE